MIENDIIELVNKEIDGSASPAEAMRLRALSSSNPEVLRLLDELRSLAHVLSHAERVDPPPALKGRIMRAIDSPRPHKQASSRVASLLDSLRSGAFGKIGLTFAGGLAAGFLVFFLTSTVRPPKSVGDAELTGTLVLTGDAPGFTRGRTINLEKNNLKGTIETQFAPGLCLVRLNLQAAEDVSVSILTDPSTVHLEAIRPSDDSGARLSVRDGEIALGGPKKGGVVLLFASKGKNLLPARVVLISSGKTVFEGVVPLTDTD
jgi:hypothetical protein